MLLLMLRITDGCRFNLIYGAGRRPFVLSSAVKLIRIYVDPPALPSTFSNVIRTGRCKVKNNTIVTHNNERVRTLWTV